MVKQWNLLVPHSLKLMSEWRWYNNARAGGGGGGGGGHDSDDDDDEACRKHNITTSHCQTQVFIH